MNKDRGLLGGYLLDGKGGARSMGWAQLDEWKPEEGPLWAHLQRDEESAEWLRTRSGLGSLTAEALVADESRPRCAQVQGGLLVVLRGVNLTPGAEPEDMVSLRLWTDGSRVFTIRRRPLKAVQEIRGYLEQGSGPKSVGDLIATIVEGLSERIGPVIDSLGDQADALEDDIASGAADVLRRNLAGLRRRTVLLRRYIGPQRDALSRLAGEPMPAFTEKQKFRVHEVHDEITRHVEELDSIRERATVIQEELTNKQSELLNRRMYLLGVVTTIFLPLGLLTGLLGINVGGIPGADWPWAFWLVAGVLVVAGALQLVLLRWLRMF